MNRGTDKLIVGVLEHNANLFADLPDVFLRKRHPCHGHLTGPWGKQAINVLGQCTFTRPVVANNGDPLTLLNRQADVFQRRLRRIWIAVVQVLNVDCNRHDSSPFD